MSAKLTPNDTCVLVTGGAGFIGSHTVVELLQRDYQVVVVDDLSNSSPVAIDRIKQIVGDDAARNLTFYEANILDRAALERIFDARVTSKLESMKMDQWGVHGRGMALFSIRQNTRSAQVVTSRPRLGSAIKVVADTAELSERADQSTWPVAEKDEAGAYHIVRGPHNIVRAAADFALSELHGCDVYLGSPAEIAATLFSHASSTVDAGRLLFIDDAEELPVVDRLGSAGDASDFMRIAESIGIEVSERTAHRILAGTIKPQRSVSARLLRERTHAVRPQDKPVDLERDRRGLKIAREDLQRFSRGMERSFSELADRYYLTLQGDPRVRVTRDRIVVTFDIGKDE